jgi:4-aminobutyrate aminotransferase
MLRFRGDIAAVFMEPVQGEGGYVVPPASFVRGVRKLCDSFGALLCDDEVQAGCFRTGKFLAIEHFNVKPDIVSLGKAVGGGIPLGATVADRGLMRNWPSGSHGSTFGGNLLACAAGKAALDFMEKNKLGENAARIGKLMMKRLDEMKDDYEAIGDVRGLGLMIGLEIVKSKKGREANRQGRRAILCKCADKGLLLLPAGESVIRMIPPLIINKEQAEKGLDIFEEAVKTAKSTGYGLNS